MSFVSVSDLDALPLTRWAAFLLPRLFDRSDDGAADFDCGSWLPPATGDRHDP
jgi:hypothetical protein